MRSTLACLVVVTCLLGAGLGLGCHSRQTTNCPTPAASGLSTPFAFLGPKYDAQIQKFYTTLTNKDIFKVKPLQGLLGESFTDTTPLAEQLDEAMTEEAIQEAAEAHRAGRRLYIGTTEMEG